MVRLLAILVCLSFGCATREGTVLIALDAEPDAAEPSPSEGDAAQDGEAPDSEAQADAGADTRGRCRIGGAKDGINEDFSGATLDGSRWLIAHGPVAFAGQRVEGGFARDNVALAGGALVLRVRGDQYEGPVRSVDANGRALASGKRSAAAVVTRDLFASATYDVEGRFVGPSGVEVALWFTRDDDRQGSIAIATPGLDGNTPSYSFVRMQSRDGAASAETQFALGSSFDDRASHILRFDWYTTADNAVVYWVDDVRRHESNKNLPTRRAGRLWIVAWLRDGAPAPFDTAEIRIERSFVTPFANEGDACNDGELEGPFLTVP